MDFNRKIYLFLLPFVLSLAFFLLGLFTISDYGINWDEPTHFVRGQAYLDFFLSGGRETYGQESGGRKSIYKYSDHQADFYLENDCCHPVINGIFFSFFNKIFFEKLGWLQDIEAYSLAGIFLSSILVFLITWFVSKEFSLLAGLVSGLSLFFYPVFFAETHFNVKDPPEALFYSACLISIYYAVRSVSWKLLLLSGILFGLAWGTKFNILFIPFIIAPWTIFYLIKNKSDPRFKIISVKIFLLSIVPVLILMGFVVFFASWPYLWQDPVNNLGNIFLWYKHIGTSTNYTPAFLLYGFNTYPAVWTFLTTPLITLLLLITGILWSLGKIIKKDKKTSLLVLILLWFFVPFIRVTVPGASLYGGVRQIMEFVPAMAILSGIGLTGIIDFTKPKIVRNFVVFILLCLFLFGVWDVMRIHPNETVYFNQIAGGLSGAYQKNIIEAGGDLGNVYRQGADWLNNNVERNARLTLINNGTSAIPSSFLRSDIRFSDEFWSGEEQRGEYVMNVTHVEWDKVFPDKANYIETLEPVFEIKIDGVPVLKIWKNEEKYLGK
ncbi:MAG: phospholipid carrier-dependent glycosyltransferase [Candidatus Levyibacteriota bacterium]